jgi:nucleoside 2-deoxyribosyltransferase
MLIPAEEVCMRKRMDTKIYLAGGFYSGWQDKVIAALDGHDYVTFFDPRGSGLKDPRDYTEWDVAHILDCDIVFAFLEASNPGGANTAFELGCAHMLKRFDVKVVIFVYEERSDIRYWSMTKITADAVFTDLEAGIRHLVDLVG